MKYVVTGGAGFIGSYITRLLVKLGHSVDIIDNLHVGEKKNVETILDKISLHQIDIRNKQKMTEILKGCNGIFHEAALTSVPESLKIPQEYFDVNVKGMENICEIAKNENLRIVFASSSSVYGEINEIPIKENSERKPINPYGKTKLECENLAQRYADTGLEIVGLRYFNVYGRGQTGTYAGVITKFLEKIASHESFKINGDGNQTRDFIHVEDVAQANIVAMESRVKSGFFNIGTGISTSINDLAKIMMKISGHKKDPIYVAPLDGDIKMSQSDTSLTRKYLNWSYRIKLDEGLSELIKDVSSAYGQSEAQ